MLALVMLAFLATVRVESVTPLPSLESCFARTEGWTGADGAHSVRVRRGLVLWLFGDTFVGRVVDGRRVDTTMPRNTVAFQHPSGFRFFTDQALSPASKGEWYWPGDACTVRGRLYLFLMRCREVPGGPPGFGFEVVGHDLVRVDDPAVEPSRWKIRRVAVPGPILLGAACVVAGDWLYAYGLKPGADRSLYVARIRLEELERLEMTAWTLWTADGWGRGRGDPTPLFPDGATEMSVSRVRGLNGFFAVYTRNGLGGDVLLRQAESPEGPWSEPLLLLRAPEAAQGLLVYGARAHPEQASAPRELVVTYNCNVADFDEHFRRPDIYRPRAVRVLLGGTSGGRPNPPAPFGAMLRNAGDRSS